MACLAVLSIADLRRRRRQDDNERLLQSIFDAVPDGLFFKDTSLRYGRINRAFAQTFRLPVDEATGRTDRELFVEHERFTAQDRALFEGGEAATFDEPMLVDGQARHVRVRKQPVFDARGRPIGIVGIAIDVTDERMLQRQLADANARLGVALHAARMGVWEWDTTSDAMQVDDGARRILGIPAGRNDARSVFERMPKEDAAAVRSLNEVALARRQVVDYEFRVVDPDGSVRWIEGFASGREDDERRHRLIGVNRDITERHREQAALAAAKADAEAALSRLEESRAQLAMAMGVGGLGVWRSQARLRGERPPTMAELMRHPFETDGNILQLIDRGDGPVTYERILQAIHPDHAGRVRDTLEAMFACGEGKFDYREDLVIHTPAGAERAVTMRGVYSLEHDAASGEWVSTFTGIVKDVTDEESLKRDLLDKAEEARLAKEAKGQFLAMMSHEIRTPMNGVLGMIDLLADTPLEDEQRLLLSRCRESSIALLRIIDDILDFSKIEAGKLGLEHKPVSLRRLAEDVCAALAPEAARRRVAVGVRVDDAVPQYVVGDPVRLRQVFTNLVGNAVKFTEDGEVGVELVVDGATLCLHVRDTGVGIAPDALRQLFRPFEQADLATTRTHGGTGLGLSIVKRLAQLMGGDVGCESTPGVGSCFTMRLPLVEWVPSLPEGTRQAPVAETMPPGARAAAARHLRVLLAEDHPINRDVIVRQLAKLGWQCDCAEDGEAAWEILRDDAALARYALLVTDCHMPRLDGYGLVERLRAHEASHARARLPVLALTANALEGERERCLAIGMDAYLSKPLQLQDLDATLAQLVPADASRPYPFLHDACAGDRVRVASLLHVAAEHAAADLDALRAAFEGGDANMLSDLAHRVLAVARQLDETALADALAALEEAARTQLQTAWPPLHAAVQDAAAGALSRAATFVSAHAGPTVA